jgi:hypothetical protein
MHGRAAAFSAALVDKAPLAAGQSKAIIIPDSSVSSLFTAWSNSAY